VEAETFDGTSKTGASCHDVAATLDLSKAAVLAGELDAAIDAASSKARPVSRSSLFTATPHGQRRLGAGVSKTRRASLIVSAKHVIPWTPYHFVQPHLSISRRSRAISASMESGGSCRKQSSRACGSSFSGCGCTVLFCGDFPSQANGFTNTGGSGKQSSL
jgi:hypothetical protein